jgi:hypothetical protein
MATSAGRVATVAAAATPGARTSAAIFANDLKSHTRSQGFTPGSGIVLHNVSMMLFSKL